MKTPLEKLKALATEQGCTLKDLTVLARQNDPFRIGTPTQVKQAEWFARTLDDVWFPNIHLREVHYSLVGVGDATLHDGSPYVNNADCWNNLQKFAKFARVLGLVDVRRMIDRRTPNPILFALGQPAKPDIVIEEPSLALPAISSRISRPYFNAGAVDLYGYRYSQADQPYHVEVWAEKSSVESELEPLCRHHGVNLMINKGFSSYTAAAGIIDRCIESGKPARVLSVSDFDGAGDDMPTALARYLEFHKVEYEGLDICLEPILMTAEIALEYGLPRTPIKSGQRQKDRFQAFHGEGCVELEALKVLHPGATAEILGRAIQKYRDPDLQAQINAAESIASDELNTVWQEAIKPLNDDWQAIRKDAEVVAARYDRRVELLSNRMAREMEPVQMRADELMMATETITGAIEYEIPDRPVSEMEVDVDHYFDSRREYLTQLPYHKRRKGQ
jgi:hypothetical protein